MTRTTSKLLKFVFAGSLVLGGCLQGAPSQDPGSNPAPVDPSQPPGGGGASLPSSNDNGGQGTTPGSASGGTGNTFDHPDNQVDPFQILQRIQDEGPPEVSSRLHSCEKMKYATLGNLLTSLGVNLKSTTAGSAGVLYTGGGPAMGVANYGARVPETIELTTAGATKLFDIFTQAAPEIITAMPNATHCAVGGKAAAMFDAGGKCTTAGIQCLTGAPATQVQVDLCNQALSEGSTPAIGQAVAVATILSAQHTCE
jgi:hypothetical protein